MSKKFGIIAAALMAGSVALAAPAQADGVKVGTLTCQVASGWGFIFGSSKDLRCNFHPDRAVGEHYVGSISKFGVFAPNSGPKRGALQGDYVGATASATVGVGVGAHALIGGLDRSITLQPLSIEGNTGLNVAGGIGALSLKYVP
jgi:hypothetical protein